MQTTLEARRPSADVRRSRARQCNAPGFRALSRRNAQSSLCSPALDCLSAWRTAAPPLLKRVEAREGVWKFSKHHYLSEKTQNALFVHDFLPMFDALIVGALRNENATIRTADDVNEANAL